MKSSTMRPKRSRSGAQSSVVSVRLSRLGERTRTLKVRVGTTINDLVKNEGLERSSIRVNRRPVRLASKLKSGDVVARDASSSRYQEALQEREKRIAEIEDAFESKDQLVRNHDAFDLATSTRAAG